MTTPVTTYVEEDECAIIEEIADHHGLSRSKTIQLLLREALVNRSHRYQHEILDAKLNRVLTELGIDNIDEEVVEDRFDLISETSLPDSSFDSELSEAPLPSFMLGQQNFSGGPDEQKSKLPESDS